MEDRKLKEILGNIQRNLSVPKKHTNSFGKYKYRKAEDIIDAVKPLLPDGVIIKTSDSVLIISERYYVKCTASLEFGDEIESATGYAREPNEKAGMDAGQITGTASSYAKKYALGNLFAVDDGVDDDSLEKKKTIDVRKIAEDIIKGLAAQKTTLALKAYWESKEKDRADILAGSTKTSDWLFTQYDLKVKELTVA